MPNLAAVVARAIAAERNRLGLTQAELGDRLGWARQTITKIEAGDRGISVDELPAICRALDVGLEDLVRRADRSDLDALRL